MLLVERYVDTVRGHLPRNQRDDIAAELRDTLRSEMEAAEVENGHPLTDDEVAGILLTVFWLLWWTDALPINQWLLWRRLPLAPAPIWDALTPPIVSVMVVHIVVSGVAILRPRCVRFYEAAILLLDLGIGVVLYRALRVPELIVATDDGARGAALAGLFNTLVTIGLLVFALLVAIDIASAVRRWSVAERRRRDAESTAPSPSRP